MNPLPQTPEQWATLQRTDPEAWALAVQADELERLERREKYLNQFRPAPEPEPPEVKPAPAPAAAPRPALSATAAAARKKLLDLGRSTHDEFDKNPDFIVDEETTSEMVRALQDCEYSDLHTLQVRFSIHSLATQTRAARFEELKKRVSALESQVQATRDALTDNRLCYRGVWQPGQTFQKGDCITDRGSVWYSCVDGNSTRPGAEGQQWILMVKRGADAGERRQP